ncbi:MAG: aminotransferase class I/II-fold pyridoxal phosphate-dependent enzyme [Phycisphaerales bacterium]|nr:aminotransferase class I/II-fold pyridoxal phosphate-dependent enzyme [Phycisphaerales bacterium]
MSMTGLTGSDLFEQRSAKTLGHLEATGQLKKLQTIKGPMDPHIDLEGYGQVDCFCSNNYLGLANHPDVVAAGIEGMQHYGAGTASVRFICGTFEPHLVLEKRIAEFLGKEAAYSFVSCWTATEALLPTLCEPGDVIISDELNHACIIDAMRLAGVINKGLHKSIYKHSDMDSLRQSLIKGREIVADGGVLWVITDGVFSMEGDLAHLPAIRALCDEYGAMLAVDDSHGTGVMGATGRGTHEHFGMASDEIDLFTGTIGKALGGAAGGYLAGSQAAMEMIVQRARPTLFTNALPVSVACSANRAIELLMNDPGMVDRLRQNTARAREGIRSKGFEVIESPTAICPIIVGDTAKAIAMSNRLLELGVFVIGFGYPVVPEGTARLRVQISAAHTDAQIDNLIDKLSQLKDEMDG